VGLNHVSNLLWQMAKTIIGGWLVDHICKNCNK